MTPTSPPTSTTISRVAATRWTMPPDRKSTRLNSSHLVISYAVFCLKKKIPQLDRLFDSSQHCRELTGILPSQKYYLPVSATPPLPVRSSHLGLLCCSPIQPSPHPVR